jgi:hypothetical protein
MGRKTRVVESVRDRKGELFLGAVALGGVGVAAATLRGDDADGEDGEDEPASEP